MSKVYHVSIQDREAILTALSRELAECDDVAFAYAYGSFVQQDQFRDIDVAVWTGSDTPRRTDTTLATELSRMTNYPVDVRVINQAPVAFLFHVLRGRVLAVRDERLLADLIERVARTYHDRAPLVRRAMREAFAP